MFNGPHGAVVAACLPAAIRVNVRALRARDPSSAALKRCVDFGEIRHEDPCSGPCFDVLLGC